MPPERRRGGKRARRRGQTAPRSFLAPERGGRRREGVASAVPTLRSARVGSAVHAVRLLRASLPAREPLRPSKRVRARRPPRRRTPGAGPVADGLLPGARARGPLRRSCRQIPRRSVCRAPLVRRRTALCTRSGGALSTVHDAARTRCSFEPPPPHGFGGDVPPRLRARAAPPPAQRHPARAHERGAPRARGRAAELVWVLFALSAVLRTLPLAVGPRAWATSPHPAAWGRGNRCRRLTCTLRASTCASRLLREAS